MKNFTTNKLFALMAMLATVSLSVELIAMTPDGKMEFDALENFSTKLIQQLEFWHCDTDLLKLKMFRAGSQPNEIENATKVLSKAVSESKFRDDYHTKKCAELSKALHDIYQRQLELEEKIAVPKAKPVEVLVVTPDNKVLKSK